MTHGHANLARPKTAAEKYDELMAVKPKTFSGEPFGDDLVAAFNHEPTREFIFAKHPRKEKVEIQAARRLDSRSAQEVMVGGFAKRGADEVCRLVLDVRFDDSKLVRACQGAWFRCFVSREDEDARALLQSWPKGREKASNFPLENWAHEELLVVCRRWSVETLYAAVQGPQEADYLFRGFQELEPGRSMYLDLLNRDRMLDDYGYVRNIYFRFGTAEVWDRPIPR